VQAPPQYWRSQPRDQKALFGDISFGQRWTSRAFAPAAMTRVERSHIDRVRCRLWCVGASPCL